MYDKDLVKKLYRASGILVPEYVGVVVHMAGVMTVAGHLARMLNQRADMDIDVGLVETAAMLHDIGWVFSDKLSIHGTAGADFLAKQGVDESIIQITLAIHQFFVPGQDKIPEFLNWESKLVFLADMTFGQNIEPFRERVGDIIRRHPMPEEVQGWLREVPESIYSEISEILSPEPFPFPDAGS